MQELLNEMNDILAGLQDDVTKFEEKGNKAAGTRVRKAMQSMKSLAQDVRVYVSNKNKANA
jgi:hypothetical protein